MTEAGIKPYKSFIDPYFKSEYQGSYFLSMLLGNDGLSIAALDIKANTYLALEEFVFEASPSSHRSIADYEQCFKASIILNANFERAVIGVVNEHTVLVPEALFDHERKSDYFNLTHGNSENSEILDEFLVNLRARNVFAISPDLKDFLKQRFPYSGIKHAFSSLIDSNALIYKNIQGENLLLHVQLSHFEILFLRDGKLEYFNSFNYTTSEDFIYYVLFAFEQLGLNPDTINVTLLGEIDSESGSYSLLYKYVRNVSFGKRPALINYSGVFDPVPSNHYYNLFQQFLCE